MGEGIKKREKGGGRRDKYYKRGDEGDAGRIHSKIMEMKSKP